jgi:hypothetical protein
MTISDDHKTAESAAVTELRVQVGILGERVYGIDKNLGSRIEVLGQKFDAFTQELKSTYATKTDLTIVDEKVRKVQDNQGWVIKLIIGAVIVAVLGLVIAKGGVPHP